MARYAIQDSCLRLVGQNRQVKYIDHNALSSRTFRERSFFEKLNRSLDQQSLFPWIFSSSFSTSESILLSSFMFTKAACPTLDFSFQARSSFSVLFCFCRLELQWVSIFNDSVSFTFLGLPQYQVLYPSLSAAFVSTRIVSFCSFCWGIKGLYFMSSWLCGISQNWAHACCFLSLRLSPERFSEPEDRLNCLNSYLEIEEFSQQLCYDKGPLTELLREQPDDQFLQPITKFPPAATALRLRSLISCTSTANSRISSPSPSSPQMLLPQAQTPPSLPNRPKLRPMTSHAAPWRKLILVGNLNTPKPPLPHNSHSPLVVLAAQQFPPDIITIYSSIASLRGTCTSASWPRPSWQFRFSPLPKTPLEVTKREYLAPAKTSDVGQTFSSCGQWYTFRARRPSWPSLQLPQPITLEPRSAKLWSLPALTCLHPLSTSLKKAELQLPLPSSPCSPLPALQTMPESSRSKVCLHPQATCFTALCDGHCSGIMLCQLSCCSPS